MRKDSNIKVYDINNGLLTPSNPNAINHKYTLNVGRQFTVEAPLKSGDKVFRYWSVSNGPSVDFDNKNSPRTTFVMPNGDITVKANYDTPYNISGTTILKLMPTAAAGMNLRLHPNYSDWQSLSYQWYEGDTASGTPLNSFDSFEIGKAYTARVTVTATEGINFTESANIRVQRTGSILDVANSRVERAADNSYLAFDLHLLTKPELTMELAPGDTLPTAEALTAQLPEGYTVTSLTWADNATAAPSSAGEMTITKLEIRPMDGSYQLANSSVWINGTERTGTYSGGILTLTDITVPVKPKGVEVSGTAVSWNDTDNAEYLLYDDSTSDADIKAEWKTGTYRNALAYTPVKGGITPNADGKRHDQTFTFDTVAAGEYKLVIVKPGGYLPSITSINVTGGNYLAGTIQLHLPEGGNFGSRWREG